jgi:hypothetical protein
MKQKKSEQKGAVSKELSDLIHKIILEEIKSQSLLQPVKASHIEISDGVSVEATHTPLREIEKTINRLMAKHQDFICFRKEFKLKTGS